MTQTTFNYTIIKESGRTEWLPDKTYQAVLAGVYREYCSAGGNLDRPNMLLLNGKVVVESGLTDLAWKYGNRASALRQAVERQISDEIKPTWEEAP